MNINKEINKDNIYIKKIKELKDKLSNYEIENHKLKILLNKNKERQYSNDISRKNLKNTFKDYSEEKNKDRINNFKEYNKSVSASKIKNKINIDKSISKNYKEDKDIKYLDEKIINIQLIKNK